MLQYSSCLSRHSRYAVKNAVAYLVGCRDRWLDPQAASFYQTLTDGGFNPVAHIDALPQHGLIYVAVPKCASSTIKALLSALQRQSANLPVNPHSCRDTGLPSPRQLGPSALRRLAVNPATLRFSFVRNPYARLVSAWADKFKNKALIAGDSFVDLYLQHRPAVDCTLPQGPNRTLSFAEFARFAITTADRRLNAHWHLQDDLLCMPGIELNFIGRVEAFAEDFRHVLEHVRATDQLCRLLHAHINESRHDDWPNYYSGSLGGDVYAAYERDFDRFQYPRDIRVKAAAGLALA